MNRISNLLLDESQDYKAFSRAFVMPKEIFIEKTNEFLSENLTKRMYNLEEIFQVELNDVVERTKNLKMI